MAATVPSYCANLNCQVAGLTCLTDRTSCLRRAQSYANESSNLCQPRHFQAVKAQERNYAETPLLEASYFQARLAYAQDFHTANYQLQAAKIPATKNMV